MKPVGYAEALNTNRPRAGKPPKPMLDHLRVYEGDGKSGGHIVEHQMDRYGSDGAERFPFGKHTGPKPMLPAGHVLAHIAQHMNIPHTIIKGNEDKATEE
jgi:hypothetical protein